MNSDTEIIDRILKGEVHLYEEMLRNQLNTFYRSNQLLEFNLTRYDISGIYCLNLCFIVFVCNPFEIALL